MNNFPSVEDDIIISHTYIAVRFRYGLLIYEKHVNFLTGPR